MKTLALFVALVAGLCLFAAPASAQSIIDVTKPINFTIPPSSDHDSTTAPTAGYKLKILVATAGGSTLVVIDCGKPALVTGKVPCVAAASVVATLVRGTVYDAVAFAYGPGGNSLDSGASGGFFGPQAPGAPGIPSFSQP